MLRRRAALNSIAFCGLAVYLLLAAISFFTFVKPSLNGTNEWRVYADSLVYMDVGDSMRTNGASVEAVALMSPARNLTVPGFVAFALQTPANIAIFNVMVFIAALLLLERTFSTFKWYVFLPIVLASPTTYEALLTLNKEIFVFFGAVVLSRWFKSRSAILMTLLILLSLVLRWEQAFVILFFLILLRLKIPPKGAATAMIIVISAAYPFAMASVDVGGDVKQNSSSALFAQLNVLQGYGLFFAVLVPKMIIALLSQVVRFWSPFVDQERLHDLPTGLFVLVDQICMCLVIVASLCRRLWVADNPVVYFIVVYCLIFLAAPENSPRYLYMLFVIIALLLSSNELQALRITEHESGLSNRKGNILSVTSANA
jgi:hypothetical protein